MDHRLVALTVVGALAVAAVGYVAGSHIGAKGPDEAALSEAIGKYVAAHPEALVPKVETPEVPMSPASPEVMAVLSESQKTEVATIVRETLLSQPEIIREAMEELQRKEDAAAAEAASKAIVDNGDLIFSSGRQVVLGNPKGDVTLVEFFDYNCGYCRRAHADMKQLIAGDPNLRVVLKEFPVLGDASVEAAQVAVAVNLVAPEKYGEYHDAMLSERGQVNGARALAVAGEIGIDEAKITEAMKGEEVKETISEVYELAAKLNLTGTPSYVTPKEVVVGAIGFDALKGKIAEARCGQPTC